MKTLTTEVSDRGSENAVAFVLGKEEHIELASERTAEEWLSIIQGIIQEVKPQLKHLPAFFRPISEFVNKNLSIGDVQEVVTGNALAMIPGDKLVLRCIKIYSRITEESHLKVILKKYYKNPPLIFSRHVWMLSEKGQIILWKASYECEPKSVSSLEHAHSNDDVIYRATQCEFLVLDDENLLKCIRQERSAIARCFAERLDSIFSEKCEDMEKYLDGFQKRRSFLHDIADKRIEWDERI
jgi:hypothetical protein